jgi:hypothetical protein
MDESADPDSIDSYLLSYSIFHRRFSRIVLKGRGLIGLVTYDDGQTSEGLGRTRKREARERVNGAIELEKNEEKDKGEQVEEGTTEKRVHRARNRRKCQRQEKVGDKTRS